MKRKVLFIVVIAVLAMLTVSQPVQAKSFMYKGHMYEGKAKNGIPMGNGTLSFKNFGLKGVFNGDTVTNARLIIGWRFKVTGKVTFNETEDITIVKGGITAWYYRKSRRDGEDVYFKEYEDSLNIPVENYLFKEDFYNGDGFELGVDKGKCEFMKELAEYSYTRVLVPAFSGIKQPEEVPIVRHALVKGKYKLKSIKDSEYSKNINIFVQKRLPADGYKDENTGIIWEKPEESAVSYATGLAKEQIWKLQLPNYSITFPNKTIFELSSINARFIYANNDTLIIGCREHNNKEINDNTPWCLHKNNGVAMMGFLEGSVKDANLLGDHCPSMKISEIVNLKTSGRSNEKIAQELADLLASHKSGPDVEINRDKKEASERGFYSHIPGSTNWIYRNDPEATMENAKNLSNIIWKQKNFNVFGYNYQSDIRCIYRADGKMITFCTLDITKEAFSSYLKEQKSSYEKMPDFRAYEMQVGCIWSRKGGELCSERSPMSTLKLKAMPLAFDKMDEPLRSKVKAGVPRFEAAAVADIKKEWDTSGHEDCGTIMTCTPNTMIVKHRNFLIYYERDDVFMKKVNNNYNDVNLLFSKFIETHQEEMDAYCERIVCENTSLNNSLDVSHKNAGGANYPAKIIGKNKGESDADYISRNMKWPSSAVSKGILNVYATISIYTDRQGNAKVEDISLYVKGSNSMNSVTDAKVNADLCAEIKRVLESAKWDPAVLGTRKVNCKDRLLGEDFYLKLSCSY